MPKYVLRDTTRPRIQTMVLTPPGGHHVLVCVFHGSPDRAAHSCYGEPPNRRGVNGSTEELCRPGADGTFCFGVEGGDTPAGQLAWEPTTSSPG
ncbi:hypothetical protein DPEC_G00272280 [Dallia pectoralis]|uniref:Uncharacterized protein n=1 Tax=Dallia pectoralis TaxID=75939 RepID=A0ACC2FQ26_DALPE|nr:hypothetical protein DPEC_G00272280 [Dallia pectoralis]